MTEPYKRLKRVEVLKHREEVRQARLLEHPPAIRDEMERATRELMLGGSGNRKPLSPQERAEIINRRKQHQREYETRQRPEVIDALREAYLAMRLGLGYAPQPDALRNTRFILVETKKFAANS